MAHVLGREDLGDGVPIVYSEFVQIIANFLRKERMYRVSIGEGIGYDRITQAGTFDYLQALRQLVQ